MIRTTVIVAFASLVLAACAKPIDTACAAFVPIIYSATQDTRDTVTQIRQHNVAWMTLCS